MTMRALVILERRLIGERKEVSRRSGAWNADCVVGSPWLGESPMVSSERGLPIMQVERDGSNGVKKVLRHSRYRQRGQTAIHSLLHLNIRPYQILHSLHPLHGPPLLSLRTYFRFGPSFFNSSFFALQIMFSDPWLKHCNHHRCYMSRLHLVDSFMFRS